MARAAGVTERTRHGATVVIVSWNSQHFLRVALDAVRAASPPETEIIVVDNHSTDGTRPFLARRPDVKTIRSPVNLGHGTALDLGFLLARTEYVVALDVDAFPVSDDWLPQLLGPLECGSGVSGAHVKGGFVHPCCLAMRSRDFAARRHTFVPRYGGRIATSADDVDAPGWDVGWKISLRESNRYLIERTSVRGPGDIGSVFGNIVYHNFYSVRFDHPKQQVLSDDEIEFGVTSDAAREAWGEAVARFLPEVV